jgi:hypothetical protein
MCHYIFQVTVAEWPFSVRVCLVLHFTQKNLDFDPLFCKMELNIMQKFWQKGIHSLFWILTSRDKKKAKKLKSPHPPHEKFGILDETKRTHKNFSILHFIIPK